MSLDHFSAPIVEHESVPHTIYYGRRRGAPPRTHLPVRNTMEYCNSKKMDSGDTLERKKYLP